MKLTKILKSILCISLLSVAICGLPNKEIKAQNVEPYAIAREMNVNVTKTVSVSISGMGIELFDFHFSGKYMLLTNPSGINDWNVSISKPRGDFSYYMLGGVKYRGQYTVKLLDYDYAPANSGAKVTLYILIENSSGSKYNQTSVSVNI